MGEVVSHPYLLHSGRLWNATWRTKGEAKDQGSNEVGELSKEIGEGNNVRSHNFLLGEFFRGDSFGATRVWLI